MACQEAPVTAFVVYGNVGKAIQLHLWKNLRTCLPSHVEDPIASWCIKQTFKS